MNMDLINENGDSNNDYLNNECNLSTNNILICLDSDYHNPNNLITLGILEHDFINKRDYIKNNFFGTIITSYIDAINYNYSDILNKNGYIYACGDIYLFHSIITKRCNLQFEKYDNIIKVVKELSYTYERCFNNIISLGEVPINIHNVGIYFRKFFNTDDNYFDLISTEHKFQSLTDSNKPTNAYRTGIYISRVEKINEQNDIKFNLLRCSSNFSGPTDNFRNTDNIIVNNVNKISNNIFKNNAELNHVLAQIYENVEINGVDKKAKIKAHSDKTKDMPYNGLMAFCTFYKDYVNNEFINDNLKHLKQSEINQYDYCYNNTSALTKLRFKLKQTVKYKTKYIDRFDITLYPNSVFLIPLQTNRLYTHEIIPPILSVDKIPTRMGYVIRCSNIEAIYSNTGVFLNKNGQLIELIKNPNGEDISKLKNKYFQENTTHDLITYDEFNFSLNRGDYEQPIL